MPDTDLSFVIEMLLMFGVLAIIIILIQMVYTVLHMLIRIAPEDSIEEKAAQGHAEQKHCVDDRDPEETWVRGRRTKR